MVPFIKTYLKQFCVSKCACGWTPGSPFLHRRQLYPAVESGVIAADKMRAVLSWKNRPNQRFGCYQTDVGSSGLQLLLALKAFLTHAYISGCFNETWWGVKNSVLLAGHRQRVLPYTVSIIYVSFFLLTGVLFVHSADLWRGSESTNADEFELPWAVAQSTL